jgi:hypothetical protein
VSDVAAAFVALVVLIAVIAGSIVLVRFVRRNNQGLAAGSGRVDSFTIGEPWRRHVAAAQAAQRRYRTQVQGLPDGPLKARMAEIGIQVDRGIGECWEVARRGHQLDATIRDLDPADLRARLDRATADREATSLRAQLGSVDRIRAARDDAEAKLRILQTRLGELVGQAAEVTHGVDDASASVDASSTGALGSAVDDVVTQLEALRLAIREVNEPLVGFDGTDPAPG